MRSILLLLIFSNLFTSISFAAIEITSASDLLKLMNQTAPFNDWSAEYILTADIDMSGYDNTSTPLPTAPIGNSSSNFYGIFNGQGYSISNISINGSNYVGLFGYIGIGARVYSLNIYNINITGYSHIGGFCGVNKGQINNCSVSGNVLERGGNSRNRYIGGFCGYNTNTGTISNSLSDVYLTNVVDENWSEEFGGFCGYNAGTILNSVSNGNISINKYCSNACDWRAGGFCGINKSGNISNCIATGDIYGDTHVGGFCGENQYGTISNCMSTGDAIGNENVGGFCGRNYQGTIEYSYSIGKPSGNSYIGGFVGYFYSPSVFLCNYWGFEGADLPDTGVGDFTNDMIEELDPADFSIQENFQCFDFNNVWIMGSNVLDNSANIPLLRSLNTVIPTLTEWAVIIFIGLLAGVGGWFLWKRFA
jgi:hypothetical protein